MKTFIVRLERYLRPGYSPEEGPRDPGVRWGGAFSTKEAAQAYAERWAKEYDPFEGEDALVVVSRIDHDEAEVVDVFSFDCRKRE